MARSNRPPSPLSSSSASSSEEDEEHHPTNKTLSPNPNDDDKDREGEEGSESEEENDEAAAGKKKTQPIAKPASDSGSESESESDSEVPKLVKPISSKPMAAAAAPSSPLQPDSKKSKKKRKSSPLQIREADRKRTKPKVLDSSKEKKRKIQEDPERSEKRSSQEYFQRIWSLEDEIAILQGILKYQKKMGILPLSGQNLSDFHTFLAPSLSFAVVVTQLSDKIRRLKKKYHIAAAHVKNGEEPQFPRSHDQMVYELSKKIWGDGNDEQTGSSHKNNIFVSASKDQKAASRGRVVGNSSGAYPFLSQAVKEEANAAVLTAFETMDAAKARVLESKFKKQKLAEMKHHPQKMDLWKETLKLVVDGMKKCN